MYGNLYGVPRAQVTDALQRGLDVLLKVDVQGAATVRRMYPESVLIFLEPPDLDTLDDRLRARGTDHGEALRIKLETARSEVRESGWFDHRVVNLDGKLDHTVAAIDEIIERETALRQAQDERAGPARLD